jgi:nucleotide-binding universal stress UspA family protein
MQTVIVGIEDSERAADALALARRLAEPSARLILVRAYPVDPTISGDGGTRYARALLADAEATLAALCEGPWMQTVAVADPHPARALARVAQERCAALVVLGASHTGRLRRVVPGSTGERLLPGSPCPVAIAPRGYANRTEPIQVVTCAYDATPDARRALQSAAQMADRLGTRLAVVRVLEGPTVADATLAVEPSAASTVRRMRDMAEAQTRRAVAELDPSLNANAVVLRGDPLDELRRCTSETDLLVIGSRGYGPLRGVMSGTLSGRLMRAAAFPLVLVPPNASARSAAREISHGSTGMLTTGER